MDEIKINREDLAKLIAGQVAGALYSMDIPISPQELVKLKDAMILCVTTDEGIKKGIYFYDTIIPMSSKKAKSKKDRNETDPTSD